MPLAWQPRSDPKAGEPHLAGRSVHECVGGLDVLVDETLLVYSAERGRESDCETQELLQLHRLAKQSLQRLAAGVLEHEQRTPLVRHKCERPSCPGGIQFGSQRVFVLYSAKTTGSGVLPERRDHKRRRPVDRVAVPVTVLNELAILAQRLVPAVRKLP